MTQVTRQELWPGVWLRTIHTHKFKSSYMSVTLLTELKQETASEYALIPYVLRRGTKNHPNLEAISAALDELYGGAIEPVVRKKGETQCIGFVGSFLDDAYTLNGESILEQAMGLMGELLLEPCQQDGGFLTSYFEGEKRNLIDKIRSQMNDKRYYAVNRMTQLMCQQEAFGVDKLGSEQTAETISEKGLFAAYERLLDTAAVELYYCGSAPHHQVEQIARTVFAQLNSHTQRIQPDCDVRIHAPVEPQRIQERMEVSQGKLAMGFRTGGMTCWEEEYPALLLCNSIFGGSTMSKLFLNVREKLSLCYYASSTLEKMKGILLVSSGIEFEKYEQAKSEILAQLRAICAGEIEDWELEGARRTLVGTYLAALDSQNQLEEYWLGQSVAGLEENLNEIANRVEQVTKEQVVAVAQKLELDTIYFLQGMEG